MWLTIDREQLDCIFEQQTISRAQLYGWVSKLYDAIRKINQHVEWALYDNEGHGWQLVETRVDFWSRVEKILQTCYDRFVRWSRNGTWQRLLKVMQAAADASGATKPYSDARPRS